MALESILKEAGPYTAPLCTAMFAAIKWLLGDRARLLKILSEYSNRERSASEQRVTESMESLRIMSESDKTLRESLAQHDRSLDKFLERLEKWGSSKE